VTDSGIAVLARTAILLRPGQVAHRARLRAQRRALCRWPQAGGRLLAGPDPSSARGWPQEFAPVDARAPMPWPDPAELAAGQIRLLGMTREIGDLPGWRQADAPQLWRFHLHYWDWAWGLAGDPDRDAARAVFARLWNSWQAAVPFGGGDAWLPYPAALRAWSWCGQYRDLAAGGAIDGPLVRALAVHAGFLRWHLESDVGGNHLIKGLKALIGLAVFFGDDRLLRRTLSRLTGQLEVQVLPDGGHYERAPAYHCQVLADLIDVAGLAAAAGASAAPELTGAIRRMRDWLGHVLLPDGQVPLLNDGYPVPAGLLAALRTGQAPAGPPADRAALAPGIAAGAADGPLVVLPDTGLVRARMGSWCLLADVGPPCPGELPAHAHADTLGCLLHVDGMPLLVDTGTSTYVPGPVRNYERSTAAHSTVQIGGADSTEVWGAFRAGRRARVSDLTARATTDQVTISAAHDGFRSLPGGPVHRRRWSLTGSGLRVDDEVEGTGQHAITVRWHLAPATGVLLGAEPGGSPDPGEAAGQAAAALRLGAGPQIRIGVTVSASAPLSLALESAPVAAGFARTAAAPVLICSVNADLPVQITSRWRKITDRPPTSEPNESCRDAHA